MSVSYLYFSLSRLSRHRAEALRLKKKKKKKKAVKTARQRKTNKWLTSFDRKRISFVLEFSTHLISILRRRISFSFCLFAIKGDPVSIHSKLFISNLFIYFFAPTRQTTTYSSKAFFFLRNFSSVFILSCQKFISAIYIGDGVEFKILSIVHDWVCFFFEFVYFFLSFSVFISSLLILLP